MTSFTEIVRVADGQKDSLVHNRKNLGNVLRQGKTFPAESWIKGNLVRKKQWYVAHVLCPALIFFFIIFTKKGPEGDPEEGPEGGVQVLSTPYCSAVCSHTIHSSWKNKVMPRMCPHFSSSRVVSQVRFKKVPLTTNIKNSLRARFCSPAITWKTIGNFQSQFSECGNFENIFTNEKKGFKKDLPALPPGEYFMFYVVNK